jgi:peptidyl-prolyl cis-trans isomerase A (cyclophilin A)
MVVSCGSKQYNHPHVLIKTEAGDIEVELYTDKAPLSAGGFLKCAEAGYYKNSSFYRVLSLDNQPSDAPKSELIQGGIWMSKQNPDITRSPHESTQQTGLHHEAGTISLARTEPGTAGTEFFICLG